MTLPDLESAMVKTAETMNTNFQMVRELQQATAELTERNAKAIANMIDTREEDRMRISRLEAGVEGYIRGLKSGG